jgi:ribosomal protein S12 methylthiotransferase
VPVEKADIVIVNTCGFVESAKKESIDAILDFIELKKKGKIAKVVVAGCLAERYSQELKAELTDVDSLTGIIPFTQDVIPAQVYLTPPHYAYVKICESCYNQCSFCAIPNIKGKFASRHMSAIVREVEALGAKGVKEINLIGQDITAYGIDLYGKKSLADLLRKIIPAAKNIGWIRLLYTFPAHITDDLLTVMASEEKICQYIDVPFQHISDKLLKSMNRRISSHETKELVKKIRSFLPGASLRTSFIVGLPGEGEKEFAELLTFIQEAQFDRLGAFLYSREEGTAAYAMTGQVPLKVKKERFARLMRAQKKISETKLKEKTGRILRVLVDEPKKNEENLCIGRTEFDAPEVDGDVYIHANRELKSGDFVDVKITDTLEYDLVGDAL